MDSGLATEWKQGTCPCVLRGVSVQLSNISWALGCSGMVLAWQAVSMDGSHSARPQGLTLTPYNHLAHYCSLLFPPDWYFPF